MAHEIEDKEISEDEYDENADEDFNPEATAADQDLASSSEDEDAATQPTKSTKKRKAGAIAGDLDSGDEATINERKAKKRRRKGESHDDGPAVAEDEDSGGEGGLIKTRAQRQAEKIEKKHRKRQTVGEVTIDVDSVWAELAGLGVGRQSRIVGVGSNNKPDSNDDDDDKENVDTNAKNTDITHDEDDLITITRRVEYAGEITEVTEQVPRSSKEAQKYLSDHPEKPTPKRDNDRTQTLTRPLKRPSIFEPNPTATIKNVPPTHPILRARPPSRSDVILAQQRATEEAEKKRKAERMTTVQKSALDWRALVDKQGLREELDEYGKSKKTYLERENFLGRVEMSRDARGREVRMLG